MSQPIDIPEDTAQSRDAGIDNSQAWQWLDEQANKHRELLLILDPMAEPNPVQQVFAEGLAKGYANIYLGTEFAALSSVAPWLILLAESGSECLRSLLNEPARNWGWLASVEGDDLSIFTLHWQERMLIEEGGQRSLYRFQDSRVIAHHLAHLEADQRAMLMGPLSGALCWNGETWAAFENPAPGQYFRPFPTPWLDIPDPAPVSRQVRHHNLLQWLWQAYPDETARMAENVHLDDWLEQQLAQAERWGWREPEQIRFLLRHQLLPELSSHPAWSANTGERPEQHYLRCRDVIGAA